MTPDGAPRLLELSPTLDVPALAAAFARDRRVQIRDALTPASAHALHHILARETPWGMSWQAGARGPAFDRLHELAALPAQERQARANAVMTAMRGRDYAFAFSSYPLVDAYLGKWAPDAPHDLLLEYINDAPVLDAIRAITQIPSLIKADAQASLYAPGHFLSLHNDEHANAGRRVAYVLSLCADDWRPEWGGYLQFYDDDGDVIAGYRPRFNALNLFAVPQRHAVTFVPPFAPVARYSLTGWFRDR